MKKRLSILSVFATVFCAMSVTNAAPLTINNPGFESPAVANEGGFSFAITGWTNSGDSGVFNPHSSAYAGGLAPEGQNVAFSASGGPTISQVLGDVLTADTIYTLTMLIGSRLDTPNPGYTVELYAGGNLLANDNNSLSPALGTFEMSKVTYLATSADAFLGQALEIRFRSFGRQTNFDDVRLDARPIPEPTTYLLALTCFALLSVHRTWRLPCWRQFRNVE